MELVNHRYRIIKSLKQNKLVSTYLVSDILDEHKEMQLNILNTEFIPHSLIDFYSNEFISLININNNNIINNYTFNVISYIDNKKNTVEQYYYTCEYIEKSKSLLEHIKNMNVFQIMDVFVESCRAINYLNLKGYLYELINLNNIFIIKTDEGYKLKLKDLATVELEKVCFIGDKSEDSYFKSPMVLSGECNSKESVIYSLGILLLTMLKKKCCKLDPKDELSNFISDVTNNNIDISNEELSFLKRLLPFVEKLITINKEYPYLTLYSLFTELNSALNTEYKLFSKEEYEKLNFHTKIIGRENEINAIMNAYDYMIKFKQFKKIFLVEGDTGTGKTRFLEEIKFLLKRANIYSSFSLSNLNDSSNKMWIDILRKLILETDSVTIDKYESELMKFFPEIVDRKNIVPTEYLTEDNTKYRLLNRIAAFISDSVKNEPTVIIVDNIHLANEFTIDTFTYLYTEVIKNRNIILVFSYKEGESNNNPRFTEFIADINKRKDAETIYLKNLDIEHSGILIKNMLTMAHNPVKLSERIYSQSYGNPLFISEVIKDFYSRKILYVNSNSGFWNIELPDAGGYNLLSIPNSIEQALINQLEDSDEVNNEILKVISIFNNPQSIKDLSQFIKIPLYDLEKAIQKLIDSGILSRKIVDTGYAYDLNNKVLKDIVYNKIEDSEKVEKHKLASIILEKALTPSSDLNELIMHLERASIKEKVVKYCIENANKMKVLKNTKAVVKNLEKAISMVEDEIEKTKLLFQIGTLHFDIGDDNLALKYFNEATELAYITGNKEDIVDALLNTAHTLVSKYLNKDAIIYLDKVEEILKNFEYLGGLLEYKRIKTLILLNTNSLEESAKICLEVIDGCGDNFYKIKANTYRILALGYSKGSKIEKALVLYSKAIKLYEVIDDTRGILISLNNIGGIYIDIYQNEDKALNYFIKVCDLSEEYGLVSFEVVGLMNIAFVYSARFNYELAYVYAKRALEKLPKDNFGNKIFYLYNYLTKLCLNMNNYTEAYHFHNLCLKELEKSPNQGLNIVELYKSSADLYEAFGDFKESEVFAKKTISFYKDGVNIEKYVYIIQSLIINIRFKEIGTYDLEIQEIFNTCKKFVMPEYIINSLSSAAIVLGEKKDYKNANRLLIQAEEAMKGQIHNEALVKYYYAKGIVSEKESCINLLQTGLSLGKKIKNKEIISKITLKLGDHYFTENNYYYSANYYIEACEVIRGLIKQIPDKYKLVYVNSYKVARAFYRIKYIKNILISHNTCSSNDELIDKFEVTSYEQLSNLLNNSETTDFIENKSFMRVISKQYNPNFHEINNNPNDILTKIGNDTIKNIELVITHLATSTLATGGLVVIEGQKQDLNVISSINDNNSLPSNKYIFDRVKSSSKPICISEQLIKNDFDNNFLSENIIACLCIPIINNYQQVNSFSSKNNILGYLYLESDRILNNFNDEGLQRCLEFINFLALLIEKHQLERDASLDKLTGALTRKYLEDELNEALERSSSIGEPFSIIMYDFDRFKNVNDRFGHQTGDEVLRKISKIVLDNIAKNDSLGRYGGEEFIIIQPNVDCDEATLFADELRKKIQIERVLGDKTQVTVSMGIVTYPIHGQTVTELIEKVDQALYVAKENGRNECQVWNSDFTNKIKPKNKLSSIISGDAVQDSRNILALLELIELFKKNITQKEKIYIFLGRIIEIVDAQYGDLLLIENGEFIENYGRRSQDEDWTENIFINEDVAKSVVNNKQGVYMIDWDNIRKHDIITGLPDWYSILVVPISVHDSIKGIIYLSVSTRIKEFSINDLNLINVLSDLAPTIM